MKPDANIVQCKRIGVKQNQKIKSSTGSIFHQKQQTVTTTANPLERIGLKKTVNFDPVVRVNAPEKGGLYDDLTPNDITGASSGVKQQRIRLKKKAGQKYHDPLLGHKKERAKIPRSLQRTRMDEKVFHHIRNRHSGVRFDKYARYNEEFLRCGFSDVISGEHECNPHDELKVTTPESAYKNPHHPWRDGKKGEGEFHQTVHTRSAVDSHVITDNYFSHLDSDESCGGDSSDDGLGERDDADRDYWIENGARLTDELMGAEASWDEPLVASSLNGSHGEWTGTDDLDNCIFSKNVFSQDGSCRSNVASHQIDRVYCGCDKLGHYHPNSESVRAISKAKRAFLERKRVRDGAKPVSSKVKASPSNTPKMILLVMTICRDDGCKQPHVHPDGPSGIKTYNPSDGPKISEYDVPQLDEDMEDIDALKSGVDPSEIVENATKSTAGNQLKYEPKVTTLDGSDQFDGKLVFPNSSTTPSFDDLLELVRARPTPRLAAVALPLYVNTPTASPPSKADTDSPLISSQPPAKIILPQVESPTHSTESGKNDTIAPPLPSQPPAKIILSQAESPTHSTESGKNDITAPSLHPDQNIVPLANRGLPGIPVKFLELKPGDVPKFDVAKTSGPLNMMNYHAQTMMVTGLFFRRNNGVYNRKPNQCLLISLSECLKTYGFEKTPSQVLDDFPNLRVTDKGYDSYEGMGGLLEFVEYYHVTIYFWRAINVGTCRVVCCAPIGLGPRVINILASPGHFEPILGFQLVEKPVIRGHDLDFKFARVHIMSDSHQGLSYYSCVKTTSTTYFGFMRVQSCRFEKEKMLVYRHDAPYFTDDYLPGSDSVARENLSSGLHDYLICDLDLESKSDACSKTMIDIQSRYLASVEKTMSANGCDIPSHLVTHLSPAASLKGIGSVVLTGELEEVHNPMIKTIPKMLSETEELFTLRKKTPVFRTHKDDAVIAKIHVNGSYFDSIKEVDIFSKIGKVINNNPSILQSIKDWFESLAWTNTGYTFKPMGNQVKLDVDVNITYEVQPTFIHRLFSLNFARNGTRNRPKASVDLVSGAYLSKHRGLVFWDLAEYLCKTGNSIGNIASGEFWTWSVNKYREAARVRNDDYFSIQKCVSRNGDGENEVSFNTVTVNTICYVISRMLIDSSLYNISTPVNIPTAMNGKSNWSSRIFGGVDTFMGVVRARRLIEDGVAVGKGLLCKGPGYSIISSHPPMHTGIYDFGLCRMLPSLCTKKMEWEFNDKFRIVSGHQFITPEGYIKFPDDPDEKLFDTMGYSHRYSTIYGFAFGHSGVIYGKHNDNIARMVERHWKMRMAEPAEVASLAKFGVDAIIGFEQKLLTNQRIFAHTHVADFIAATVKSYGVFEYFTYTQEAAGLLILEKHTKQGLRIDAHGEMTKSGDIAKKLFIAYLVWKVKEMELAKYGKPPRAIVDAQTGNSLPSVHISNAWKSFSADKIVVYNNLVSIEFVSSPSPPSLCRVFASWDFYSYPVVIKNYSDDSIVGIWSDQLGRYEVYNTDIRANDGSHTGWTWSVFANLLSMTDEHRDFLYGMIFAKNYVLSRNKKHRVTFVAKYGYLPSGIGETSIANNTAMLMMAYMFSTLLRDKAPRGLDTFTYAAYLCGFLLTFEKVDLSTSFSCMQFLKNSPCRLSDGSIISIPNLGRMLRYSGRSKSDITPKMFPPPAGLNLFLWYQTLLTYGDFKRVYYKPLAKYLCPYYSYVDYTHFDKILTLREDLNHLDFLGETFIVNRETYYSRYLAYGCTFEDIQEFEHLVAKSDLGHVVYCKMVDIVLFRDYGLAPITI